MNLHDIIMILVMTFPMFIFTVYPGILISDYLEKNYQIQENQKRFVMVGVTFIGALVLSALLYII
jgi:hypothetical protein